MAAPKTSIQKDLSGDNRLEIPLKKIRPNGKDAYPQGSERQELEARFEDIIYEDLTLGSQVSTEFDMIPVTAKYCPSEVQPEELLKD